MEKKLTQHVRGRNLDLRKTASLNDRGSRDQT